MKMRSDQIRGHLPDGHIHTFTLKPFHTPSIKDLIHTVLEN